MKRDSARAKGCFCQHRPVTLHEYLANKIEAPRLPSSDALRDAPEHAGRVSDDEVAHAPGPVGRWLGAHAVLHHQACLLDASPPGSDVEKNEMHQVIFSLLLAVEMLEQETAVAVSQVSEVII